MKNTNFFDEIQSKIQELIRNSPAADIEKNVKAFMAQTFSKMDLVTRDEFDVQRAMVDKLRERVEQLEAQLESKS
ncbi:conserved hypothetical protein [Taylorella asinigenitalis 14/45]|uniref:Ubiquinone biosynthesis accessory factor UbiK n=2 Tax=Taylorella asinigenitalis TaxID=84590 RepID=G4QBY8_TAYAM|nr:accessory factor UbiK family protein [Taylorella asinigenitalis]AEP36804.1 hypothetical protein TASI_1045 [Taylorella asinigenitalis MCE3]CCG20122.1 conserved hypothetical protein [Taylorella asinigenitalis 14/45]